MRGVLGESGINHAGRRGNRSRHYRLYAVTTSPPTAPATLAVDPDWQKEPAAYAWLWKDHTGHAEAAEITATAKKMGMPYLGQVRRNVQQRVVLVEDSALRSGCAGRIRSRCLLD